MVNYCYEIKLSFLGKCYGSENNLFSLTNWKRMVKDGAPGRPPPPRHGPRRPCSVSCGAGVVREKEVEGGGGAALYASPPSNELTVVIEQRSPPVGSRPALRAARPV